MLSKHRVQDYGDDPLAVRGSDKYQEEYVHAFVDKWDELIDREGRASAGAEFFIGKLREHGARKVLDVATGTGFHAVQLIEAGHGYYDCGDDARASPEHVDEPLARFRYEFADGADNFYHHP